MNKQTQKQKPAEEASTSDKVIKLSQVLTKKTSYQLFDFWIAGDTPLICHAWSHKAKGEMLQKQVKAIKAARELRDPDADFVSSLYEIGDDIYGFPVTGVKRAILECAHKDRGVPRTEVMRSLFFHANMVKTVPALAGAICNLPIVRVYGNKPEMREDMVRVGAGLNKTASLAYRGQFSQWAIRLKGKLNTAIVPTETLVELVNDAGVMNGIGEWRNQKGGVFGAFHLATGKEEEAWIKFASGKGPLPMPEMSEAAE